MTYLKNKCLFFTTSPRTPSKMIPEIRLLNENLSGKKWDKTTQIKFIDLLSESNFFEGHGSPKNKDFSARDRINRSPKALGFVDLKPVIKLTNAGNAFVYGKRPQEIFLRQILKFQLPSPYHVEPDNIVGTFSIKPYLEIIRLIRELETLSFDELKIYGLTLTNYRDFDSVKEKIINFRTEKKEHKGKYKKFADEVWTNVLLTTFSEKINSGKTKTRETKDNSLKKFLKTKKRNARDYTDACFRYLRYTGLFSISHKNRTLSIYPDKVKEVDFILENVSREPVYVSDMDKYKNYLFDSTIPALYTDNIENIKDVILRMSNYTQRELSDKSLDELKDLRDEIVSKHKEAIINTQVTEIKSYALYSEIMDTYNEIISDELYDAPLMLEYNTWRAMTMLDGGKIKGNFKFDDAGQPLSTAAGNQPDIECDYDDFVLSVEVTMQNGQRQYESEGEPVARHFGQLKKKTGKDTYCLFIAPTINHACLAHFYALNQIKVSYYGGVTKIIPLNLDQFMRLIDKSYNYPTRPNPENIRQFLDEAINLETDSADENDWNNKIQRTVSSWLAA